MLAVVLAAAGSVANYVWDQKVNARIDHLWPTLQEESKVICTDVTYTFDGENCLTSKIQTTQQPGETPEQHAKRHIETVKAFIQSVLDAGGTIK